MNKILNCISTSITHIVQKVDRQHPNNGMQTIRMRVEERNRSKKSLSTVSWSTQQFFFITPTSVQTSKRNVIDLWGVCRRQIYWIYTKTFRRERENNFRVVFFLSSSPSPSPPLSPLRPNFGIATVHSKHLQHFEILQNGKRFFQIQMRYSTDAWLG